QFEFLFRVEFGFLAHAMRFMRRALGIFVRLGLSVMLPGVVVGRLAVMGPVDRTGCCLFSTAR
ncbi:MAG: hypothetical protein ABF297_07890, partial [Thiogranum sp.]